ncbi:MAG: acetaldehyde dehydrogenase, partial [Anaerovoracaceae bacterium]
DEEVIRQFALKKPVGRVLVNTPATFGSMGATTNLFPAMTLGSGSAGKGITSENVSPLDLIYVRKVGFGMRKVEALDATINLGDKGTKTELEKTPDSSGLKELYSLLKKAMEDIEQ